MLVTQLRGCWDLQEWKPLPIFGLSKLFTAHTSAHEHLARGFTTRWKAFTMTVPNFLCAGRSMDFCCVGLICALLAELGSCVAGPSHLLSWCRATACSRQGGPAPRVMLLYKMEPALQTLHRADRQTLAGMCQPRL